MRDAWLSGRPEPKVAVSTEVVKSALDGAPVRVTRAEGRSVMALTPGELLALEKSLAADPTVIHWTVTEQTVSFDGEGS